MQENTNVDIAADRIRNSRKYSVKGKVRRGPGGPASPPRRKRSERNTDPFQNLGFKMERL